MKYKFLFAAFVSACAFTQVNAQTKPATKPVVRTIKPFKVPPMVTLLGQFKDSVGLPLAEIIKIVALPLQVVDDRKVVYNITSYQLLYRQKTVSETEDGRAVPATSLKAERFYATPLPVKWINYLKEELKKGEELYFFDIIAKDPQGRVMYAPTVKISVL